MASFAALAVGLSVLAGSGVSAAPSDPSGLKSTPDQQRLMQIARALVRLEAVRQNCPLFYAVDIKKLDEIQRPVFTDAISRFGKERLHRAVNTVEPEVVEAIREGGTATWCPAQREHYDSIGIPGLIGDVLP
ncbi:hypothetical protein Q8W71_29845 [Methylobacterium sp. NEAU 140]|uniref:hypothetical protein n=1 Tax=Methylobacterium sp. NEAU 140 TaxID=3064945 RepID=UPI0027366636|nr:hypothetical protein [Methylobacterium sp. NEAU 140]MDP4026812.1 hypothetical protein [Methylobacterium sp. NEAU 140]